jgi:gluconate 5-dehydrogenase
MTLEMFNLSGKRALITGSSQGIGFALARGLASAGAEIILNGRDQAKLATAAQELGGEGATVQSLAFDATDHAAVRRAVDGFEAEVGAIDILINNAGMQHRTALQDFQRMPLNACCRPISRRFFMWAKRLPVI